MGALGRGLAAGSMVCIGVLVQIKKMSECITVALRLLGAVCLVVAYCL